MMLHRSNGDYNTETSVYIWLLNPRCNEEDIIEELNLVFKDERVKKEKSASLSREEMGKGNKDGAASTEKKWEPVKV